MSRMLALGLGLSLVISSTLGWAQNAQEGKQGANVDDAIKGVYAELASLSKNGEWEKGAALMTPEAQDEICADIVVMAYGIRNSDVPDGMTDFEDSQDALGRVMKDFKIDGLKMNAKSIRISSSPDTADGDDVKQAMAQAAKDREVAAAALKQVEKRWDLIRQIQAAMAKLPFFQSPVLVGEITDIEISNDRALVTVKPTPQKREEQGGVQVHIVAPPRVVNFHKVDGKWLFAGLNREKSDAAARREFEKIMPGAGSDF